jgi:hypothetical protein
MSQRSSAGRSQRGGIPAEALAGRVLAFLNSRFDHHGAITAILGATKGDAYLFGGTLRRQLFGESGGDLDIMVPNGDDRAFIAMAALGVPAGVNSQGLRRYKWGSVQIDMFQPREFFSGFEDVESALRFFDLRINALALHFSTQRILDPFAVIPMGAANDPGINWPQWTSVGALHTVKLAIRLAKLMYEVPSLTISAQDAHRLRQVVVPRLETCDWDDVRDRFPSGKAVFLDSFDASVLKRARLAAV